MKFMEFKADKQYLTFIRRGARMAAALSLLYALSFSVQADELGDAQRAYGAGEFAEAAALLRPLAREGRVEAQYLLGRMYEQGDGVAKDLDEARRLYQRAAEQGHDDAGQKLALFENADSGEESVVLEWYMPAAEEGDMEAQYNLGFMYETGWGVGIDEARAANWYGEASELQHDMAQLRLGMMYIVGRGVDKNSDKGVELLRLAAENGNRVAEVLVQEIFDIGELSDEASEKIISGLRRVVDQGEQQALNILNRNLDQARAKKRRTPPKVAAKTPDQKATSSKDDKRSTARVSEAQFNIARAMDKGTGVPKNEPEMVKWYLTSARQGNADAQFQLGVLYMQGRGVSRDVQEGMRWFNAASAQGHELAADYLQLWSNELDNATLGGSIAVTWLKENARNWDLDSLFMLGQMFETGRGVNKNLNEAGLWYRLAAEGGHKEARRRMDLMGQGKATTVASTATPKTASPATQQETITTGKAVATQFDWFWMILGIAGVVGLGFVIFILFRRGGSAAPGFAVPRSSSVSSPFGASDHRVSDDDVEFLKGLWDDKPDVKPPGPVEQVAEVPPAPVVDSSPAPEEGATEVFKAVTWGKGGARKPKPIISEDDIQLPDIKAVLSEETVRDEPVESKRSTSAEKPIDIAPPANNRVPPVEEVQVTARRPMPEMEPDRERSRELPAAFRSDPPEVKPDWSRSDSQVVEADKLTGGAISRDALAAGRINAQNLVDDFSIDREGKATQRIKPREPAAPEPEQKKDGPIDFADLDLQSIRKGGEQQRPAAFSVKSEGPVESEGRPLKEEPVENMRLSAQAIETDITSSNDPEPPAETSEEQSLAEVHFNIGLMFANGDGVPRNDAMAAKWFLKSAQEGLAEAQFRIGEKLLSGSGIEKDPVQGAEWIRKAADNGFVPAQEFLQKRNQA